MPPFRPIRNGVPASTVQLPAGAHASLLDYLCMRFPGVTRETWTVRMVSGGVLDTQHRPLHPESPYVVGQEVHYFREVEDEPVIPGQEEIIHADEHLVVADKPHFLPVAPTGAYVRQTLLTRLVDRLDNPDLVPLHRIDRDTAGLVLFSANRGSRDAYQSLFRERLIVKQYLAVAPSLPDLGWPLLRESRLEPGLPFFRMQEVEGQANSASRIEMTGGRGDGMALYRLSPVTGRKHQLRVHMAAIGAPILNDRTYPELLPKAPDDPDRPLQLLAQGLAFQDPINGAARRFVSGRRLSACPSASPEVPL